MSTPLLAEWNESRRTIARFDGYLLRLRVLAASSFSIFLVAIIGLLRAKPNSSELVEFSLIALGLLHFYISVIFVLDRYYERMLMISVNRASRLEAVRLNDFKIGLTTEIEEGKNNLVDKPWTERLASYLASAGKMLVFVYSFVFLVVLFSFASILARNTTTTFFPVEIHWFVFSILALLSLVLVLFSNNLMSQPVKEAKLRAQVANSPEILSSFDINNCLENMSADIEKWLIDNKSSHLSVICILNGARRVTEELVIKLKAKNINCKISYIKTKSTEGIELANEIKLEYGNISKPESSESCVLIVDDLVDSGRTIKKVKEHVENLKYSKVRTAALLNKYENVDEVDFIGFDLHLSKENMKENDVSDYWLFGYGMDINGYYRNLDYIGWLEKKI